MKDKLFKSYASYDLKHQCSDVTVETLECDSTESIIEAAKIAVTLYDNRTIEHLTYSIAYMIQQQWNVCLFSVKRGDGNKENVGLAIFKTCYRMHTGNIMIIDTLICNDTNQGLWSAIVNYINDITIDTSLMGVQLDCAVDNTVGQKFYYKEGFKIRAFSFIK